MSLITKIFGTYSDHQLKKLESTVRAVDALATNFTYNITICEKFTTI